MIEIMSLNKIAGSEYPIIRQTMNTCGLASIAMVCSFHSKSIIDFLVELYGKHYMNSLRVINKIVKKDSVIIWSMGYLLLKARSRKKLGNWISELLGGFEYDDFNLNIELLLNKPPTRRFLSKYRNFTTLLKYYDSDIIRKPLIEYYLDQFKTQIELKVLAAMLGLKFVPYPEDILGILYFNKDVEENRKKLEFLMKQIKLKKRSVLMGHGQSHWMVPHSLYATSRTTQEYVLGVNDPIGRPTMMPLHKFDHKYIFYFFEFDKKVCSKNLEFLRELFYL